MNKVELFVYNLVKNNPILKQRIVDAYQALLRLVPQRALDCSLPYTIRKDYFFGFHDKSPFSSSGKALLAHHNLIGNRIVQHGDTVEVGVFNGTDWNDFTRLGTSTAWNWQLGSMLQWVGEHNVAFNTIDNGTPRASIVDIDSRSKEIWPFPVAHVSPDCNFASSYDFLRVEAAMPGYGAVVESAKIDDEHRNSFRIFRCADGVVTFKISLGEAAAISPHASMEGAFHFFHHSLFDPTSKRCFFLHRWVDQKGRRWTRMFSVGVDGNELYLFPMDEMVSHITWTDDRHVFAYARMPKEGDGYYLIEDITGHSTRFFSRILNSDGHPTFDPSRQIVITDTYPDRFRNQYLILGLPKTHQRVNLARFHLPMIFRKELQVDLHPRLHPTRSIACVDTGHTGSRALMTIDFSESLK